MGLVKCIGKGEVTRPLILPTRPQTIGVDDCYVLTALPGGLKYCFGFLLCFGFVSFAVVPGVKNTGSGSDSAITVWCGLKQHAFLSGPHLIACVQSGPCYITTASWGRCPAPAWAQPSPTSPSRWCSHLKCTLSHLLAFSSDEHISQILTPSPLSQRSGLGPSGHLPSL